MKAVDPALAHAQSGDASFLLGTPDKLPTDHPGEETDCAIITAVQRATKLCNGKVKSNEMVIGCNGISDGQNKALIELNGKSDEQIGNIKNAKDNNVGAKFEVTRTNSDRVNGQDITHNGNSQYPKTVVVNGNAKLNGRLESGDKVIENGHDGNAIERAESPITTWDRAVAEMKEHAFSRLQDELKKAHQELKLRDEEVTRLSRIRQDVEAELEDLTASLFQEAHNMVREANVKQAAAERAHRESQMQVDVLVAEVSALKTLVLTSTPSRPNPHLHPQIDLRGNRTKDDSSLGGTSLFNKKHRRSPSHFNLKYGRENSPPDSPVKEAQPLPVDVLASCKEGWEVDPDVHREFTAWKLNPKLDKTDPFISRIYNEEINLCLDFPNKELSAHVRSAVETGNIFIEAVSDKTKTVFPKKCALLDVPRQCHYRMKFGDQEQWYCMSQICRNRIIAVCDFLNYLKYIERGLVKSSVHDVYWEITRLRKDMVLARLGLALAS